MWTAVYVAECLDTAKEIENILNKEGFLVKIEVPARDGDDTLYEILAPELEAQEVYSVLLELGYM